MCPSTYNTNVRFHKKKKNKTQIMTEKKESVWEKVLVGVLIAVISAIIIYFLGINESKPNPIPVEVKRDTLIIQKPDEETSVQKSKFKEKNQNTIEPSKSKSEKYSFILVLNSDQVNSKKFIDGKPATIISGRNSVYQEIEVNELRKEYHVRIAGNGINCEDSVYIDSARQKVFLCD